MKPNEYNMKEGENNLDSWIEIVERIEGVKYKNFPGIKISDVTVERRILDGRGEVITNSDIQLLIRILRKVSILPNRINASYDNTHLVLKYIYDSKETGVFLINSEGCKYAHMITGKISPFQTICESDLISEINNTIQAWKDKL